MSYQSPIEVIQTQMRNQIEGNIYQAVMNVGVYVDKEELIKALQYDRKQYQKGYDDRDGQIVRCKDCKHWDEDDHECNIKTGWFACGADWFCADGEMKDK